MSQVPKNLNYAYTIIGSHAGESISDIFARKIQDCEVYNHTYWLFHSNKVSEKMYNETLPSHLFFLLPKHVNGASPTKISNRAQYYASYKFPQEARKIDFGLSPVTGKLSKNSKAFVLKNIITHDLLKYPFNSKLHRFSQFAGTHIWSPNTEDLSSYNDFRYCIGSAEILDCGIVY